MQRSESAKRDELTSFAITYKAAFAKIAKGRRGPAPQAKILSRGAWGYSGASAAETIIGRFLVLMPARDGLEGHSAHHESNAMHNTFKISPLNYLHQIGRLQLLQALYGRAVIPTAVEKELRAAAELHGYHH